jgi:TRAP transporter TAXI family solute receptor
VPIKLPTRRLLPATLLTFVLLLAAVFAVWSLLKPAPPRRIVMTTGAEGGAYAEFGRRYATELAREGITVELRSSAGTVENLQRLERGEATVGLVQTGQASETQRDTLLSLGSLYFEPVWILHRDEIAPRRLTEFKGLRVGVGLPGSGSRALALRMLELNGLGPDSVTLVEGDVRGLVLGVSRDEIDVAIAVVSIDAPLFRELVGTPGVRLMDLERAVAYERRMPEINRITLPAGVLDLANNVPGRTIDIVAATATLVVAPSLHPAVQYLLWRAARRIHAEPTLLSERRTFPTIELHQEFEVPEDVERLYEEGAPVLYRYLPFWLANLVYRLWLSGITAFALFVAFTDWIPTLLRHAINVRVWRNYLASVQMEMEIPKAATPADRDRQLERVTALRRRTEALNMPLVFEMSKSDLVARLQEMEETLRQAQAGDAAGAAVGSANRAAEAGPAAAYRKPPMPIVGEK